VSFLRLGVQTHDIPEPRRALQGLVSDDNAIHNDAVGDSLIVGAFEDVNPMWPEEMSSQDLSSSPSRRPFRICLFPALAASVNGHHPSRQGLTVPPVRAFF
jgi:hypothetical protein